MHCLRGALAALFLVVAARPAVGCTNALELLLDQGTVPAELRSLLEDMSADLGRLTRALDEDPSATPELALRFKRGWFTLYTRYQTPPAPLAAKVFEWRELLEASGRALAEVTQAVDRGDLDGAKALLPKLDDALQQVLEPPHRWLPAAGAPPELSAPVALAMLGSGEALSAVRKSALLVQGSPVVRGSGAVAVVRLPGGARAPGAAAAAAEEFTRLLTPASGPSAVVTAAGATAGDPSLPLADEHRAALLAAGVRWYVTLDVSAGSATSQSWRDELDPTGATRKTVVLGWCEGRLEVRTADDDRVVHARALRSGYALKEVVVREVAGGPYIARRSCMSQAAPARPE